MDKLAKKEREKLKCSKAVSIGKGLVVLSKLYPEDILNNNMLLKMHMFANR